jgi:uncharacterized protein with HEPN domain
MSVIDDRTRLQHMLEASRKISLFVRLIEIIGEAASRISGELKLRHASVPWSAIVGMRNRLVHACFSD